MQSDAGDRGVRGNAGRAVVTELECGKRRFMAAGKGGAKRRETIGKSFGYDLHEQK